MRQRGDRERWHCMVGSKLAVGAGDGIRVRRIQRFLLVVALSALAALLPATTSAQASPLTSFAYVTNTGDNTVSVVNTSTNAVVATIPVLKGAYPAQKLAAAPDGRFVYAASFFGGIVAIDTATNTVAWQMTPPSVIEEVPPGTHFTESDFLPGLASDMAVSPDNQFLYVSLQATNVVAVVNTTTHKMIATISVGSCPSGMDIAPNNSRLYVVNLCSESLSVIDPSTKLVTGTVLPDNEPANVAVSPNSAFAYVTGSKSDVVLNTSSNAVTGSLPLAAGGSVAFSPNGATAYLPGGPGPGPEVSALATDSKTITASIPVAEYPWDLAITPDGKSLYLVNENANDLSVVSTASNTVTGSVPVGEYPQGLAITPPIEGQILPPQEPSGTTAPPASAPSVPPLTPNVAGPVKPKPLKCRKGFKKQKFKGKVRCVKLKKKHRRAAAQSSGSVSPMPITSLVSADDGNLTQSCVEQELVSPTVTKAELFEPGKYSQSEVVSMDVAATPEECHGVVERMVQFEVIKNELLRINGKLRHQVIRLLWFGYDGYTREIAGPMGISGAANPHRPDWVYYHCSVGRAVTKVRLKIRVIVTNLATQKEAGRKIFWGPRLKIRGIGKGRGC